MNKSDLLLALATRSRQPVAHGGNPQDRTDLAIRDFTHLCGLKTLHFVLVHAGGRELV
jgi:hypothetical protein